MGRQLLKLRVERSDSGKFFVYFKQGKEAYKIEYLSQRQVEQLWRFLKALGFGAFIYGKRREIKGIKVSDYAKVYTDDVFKTKRKLQPWEVYDG